MRNGILLNFMFQYTIYLEVELDNKQSVLLCRSPKQQKINLKLDGRNLIDCLQGKHLSRKTPFKNLAI